jgi:hypothetical protein
LNIIFYTKEFNEKITSPVTVVLSPQFYWIKKIDIPVKSIYQAKKIAQNIFDLQDEKYNFGAFKAGNDYFAYAIDKHLGLKIDKKYIKNVYLAQSELYKYDCINVDESHCIKKINGLLFCFPREDNDDCADISEILKNIKLSKNKISLDTINIDKPVLILIFLIFIIANISFFVTGYLYDKYSAEIQKQKTALLNKYNLPSTSYQLSSIYESMAEMDLKQKNIKKDLEYFTNTPLKKNEYYDFLAFDSNAYDVIIKSNKSFDTYFKKEFKIINSSFKNNKYIAKLEHE